MEFKVGDRVKYGGCVTGTIVETNVGCCGDNLLFLADEGQGFCGHNGLNHCKGKYTGNRCFYPFVGSLELLPQQITITSDGHKTTAEHNGKSAVAKCNPSDTFDIFKGAKLALERLEEKENFKPHLEFSTGNQCGNIGELTNIKDELGNKLDIGDTVRVYRKGYKSYVGELVIAKDNTGYFVMGLGCTKFPSDEWLIIKERSHNEVTEDKVGTIEFVRTPRIS